jgi:hypothetical protein
VWRYYTSQVSDPDPMVFASQYAKWKGRMKESGR